MLEGFELIETVTGIPSLSVTKNGISFNKSVLEKLNCPEYVKALLDKDEKRFAIVPCNKEDRGSRAFYREGKDLSSGVRWNNYDLKSTLEALMGWNLAVESWKASGVYFEADNAMVFDLKTARK